MIQCTPKNNKTVDFHHDASNLPIATAVLAHILVHWESSTVHGIFKGKTTAVEAVATDTPATAALMAAIETKNGHLQQQWKEAEVMAATIVM